MTAYCKFHREFTCWRILKIGQHLRKSKVVRKTWLSILLDSLCGCPWWNSLGSELV